jgi:hypothetical protein
LNLSIERAALLTELRESILKEATELRKKGEESEPTETYPEIKNATFELYQSLTRLSSIITTMPRENIILQSIQVSSIKARVESMESAADGSFNWMFKDENEADKEPVNDAISSLGLKEDECEALSHSEENCHKHNCMRREELLHRASARANFLTWLRCGEGVFHISGKAGSGKSTLMKFLCAHKSTKKELQIWAGEGRKLVFASHYFWKASGDELQMSLAGLQRSILFETLKHCPDLIPSLFERQWNVLSNNVPFVIAGLISDSDTKNAFEALIRTGSFLHHRFCFFIDGLDEFHGQHTEHLKLSRDLQRWASSSSVKICASSRPYLEFNKLVTSDDRRIHLHELTRHDIYLFSRQMIEDNLLDDLERVKDYYLRLVERVVERSDGVFLWARLVVCSLLEGMLRHDKEGVLNLKLDAMPRDLNGLYTELLNNLDYDDRIRAEKMMLLTACSPLKMGCVSYAFIDYLGDPNFPPCNGEKPVSWGSFEETAKDVELQLKSLTKGLLETVLGRSDDATVGLRREVQFFHRTVRDFILEDSKLDNISRRFPSLTTAEASCRLYLAELLMADLPMRVEVWNASAWYYPALFNKISPEHFKGYRIVTNNVDIISEPTRDIDLEKNFVGVVHSANGRLRKGRLSFTLLAAAAGQEEYLFQQIAKSPDILRDNRMSQILFSAADCGRTKIFQTLLRKALSPVGCVARIDGHRSDGQSNVEGNHLEAIPLWLVIAVHLIEYYLEWRLKEAKFLEYVQAQWDVLELLLQDKRVDASRCFFLLSASEGSPTSHFITLKQFIQDANPRNMVQLLGLLAKGNANSFINGTNFVLSNLSAILKWTGPVGTDETSEYTPFRLMEDNKSNMVHKVAICDNLRVDGRLVVKLF